MAFTEEAAAAVAFLIAGCGIGFGVLGFRNMGIFFAYLVLGAEGYFTLVICVFRFIIAWHEHHLSNWTSWLEPRDPPNTNKTKKRLLHILLGPFELFFCRDNPMVAFHSVLVVANVAIVFGSSYVAGADIMAITPDLLRRLNVSKISRTVGQSLFLACNTLLLGVILTMRNNRRNGDARGKTGSVHPTLILLLIVWFPLIVRGVFGVLQSAVFEFSYFNIKNYRSEGYTKHYTTIEYLLGVLPEWLACVVLNLTYLASRNDPPRGNPVEAETQGSEMLTRNK
ncbi:hypothetical protein C8J57DRAFT_1232166 [Mycena rebaudengoi]|nr:hypothetical protein C8J57DRAFT_1232166 [Mycena rebaudengoi]